MAESHRAALTRLLADTSTEEWHIASQVLQQTFAWCATVATPTHLQDRVHALNFLFELQVALATGDQYLALLPALVEQAIPGQKLETVLEQQRTTLAKSAHELARLREQVEVQQRQEKKWQTEIAERATLEARRAELERLSRLAEEVETLRRQVAHIEQHRSAAEHEVEHLEAYLSEHTQGLIILSEQHLACLQEQIRTRLEQAASQEAELQHTIAEWRVAYARYEELEHVLTEHREILRLHQEADKLVADALGEIAPDVRNAQELLSRVQQFLEQADQILAKALEAHARANHAPALYVGGGNA
jgi:chromosome segregation ATPase